MNPVNIGDVYAISFNGIAHDKYCIVTGISSLGTYIYSVFINTSIDFIKNNKPHLLPLQIKITQNKNRFLKYDSYVGCEHNKVFTNEQLKDLTANGYCRSLGKIDIDDLKTIKETIINSELLSPEELLLYFQIPIT